MLRPEKVLTLQLLKEYQGRITDLRLSAFTSIEDAAAAILPEMLGTSNSRKPTKPPDVIDIWRSPIRPMYLQNLTTLSDTAAMGLSDHRGYLDLSGLRSLSDGAAEWLSYHKGTLHLNGLSCLSDKGAAVLSRRGERSWLFHEDDIRAASGLIDKLCKRVKDPSKSKRPPKDGAIEANVEILSDHLWAQFTSEAREIIADPETPVEAQRSILAEVFNQILSGKKLYKESRFENVRLSCETQRLVLRKPTGTALIRLNRFLLCDAYPKELANIPPHGSYLGLSGLTALSDAAAEALSKHSGVLALNGLLSLPDDIAETLSNHFGALHLQGLPTLSKVAARALSFMEGRLYLNRSISLSKWAADVLCEHENSFIHPSYVGRKQSIERLVELRC